MNSTARLINGSSNKARALHAIPVALSVILIACLFGIASALGNILIAFVLGGAVVGFFLLFNPPFLLYLTLLSAFIVAGSAKYFGGIEKAHWLVFAAAIGFWILGFQLMFSHYGQREGQAKSLPLFIKVFFAFCLFSVASSVINKSHISEFVVGAKCYFFFIGITVAVCYGAFKRDTLVNLLYLGFGVALLQFPVTLYQYMFIRSRRLQTGGFRIGDSAVEASDSVVGTFGGLMDGGGHGDVMAAFACIAIAGILLAWRKGVLSNKHAVVFLLIAISPVFMAETKVIFFFFPVVILVVWWDSASRNIGQLIAVIIVSSVILYASLWGYYVIHWSHGDSSFSSAIERSFSYSFAEHTGTDRSARGDMGRREAIEYWWKQEGLHDPVHTLIGNGMAASKSSSTYIETGLVRKHFGRRLDKTGLSGMLWDVGVLGTSLFVLSLMLAVHQASRLANIFEKSVQDYLLLKVSQVGLLLTLLGILYRNSVPQAANADVLMCLLIGIVGFYYLRSNSVGNACLQY
ncbi:MAG: hypothetical protein ACRERU_00545 [Methylococcales bacterium]